MAFSTDTTVTFVDPAGAYAGYYADLTRMIQAAVGDWQYYRTTPVPLAVEVNFTLTGASLIAGSSPTAYTVDQVTFNAEQAPISRLQGTFSLVQSEAGYRIRTSTDPGTGVDMTISVSPGVLASLWFDPNPAPVNPAVTLGIGATQYDAYTLVRHAVGQGLGLWGLRDPVTGALTEGTSISLFDRYIVYSAGQPYFTGPNAVAVYGGPVPLVNGDPYHYVTGVAPLDGLMSANAALGQRTDISPLDRAILRDVRLSYNTLSQTVTGTTGNDSLYGNTFDDVISGLGGNDYILAGAGDDLVAGGGGDDQLHGDPVGLTGSDILLGQDGNDRLSGGNGNDHLDGGIGNDALFGELGQDLLIGGIGSDTLYGDFYAARNINQTAAVPTATAPTANDDTLDGGVGNDVLHGGGGQDTMAGGPGSDRFAFTDVTDSTADRPDVIVDFRGDLQEVYTDGGERTAINFYSVYGDVVNLVTNADTIDFRGNGAHSQRDRLDFSEFDAQPLLPYHQGFTFIGQSAFSGPGQIRWQIDGADILVQANVDLTPTADFVVRLAGIGGSYPMSERDFLLGTSTPSSSGTSSGANAAPLGYGAATSPFRIPTGITVDLTTRTAASQYHTIQLPAASHVIGGEQGDRIIASLAANRLWGGGGDDTILGGGGNDMIDGGGGNDWITLGDAGGVSTVGGAETLVGGAGGDWANLADGGNSLILAAIETLVGGSAGDWVNLGNRGSTMILAAVETLVGGANGDWINLGNRGNTTILAAVETLVGGTGQDRIALGNRGNTVILTEIETLIGGAGQDRITLGNRGNTITVSGIDTLAGGIRRDSVTVASGPLRFEGGGGADNLVLVFNANADTVLFGSPDDGGAAGQTTVFDEVWHFQSGTDRIGIHSALRAQIDRNGDGQPAGAERGTGQASLISDEVIRVTARASLTDDGFTALRTALGTVATDETARSALLMAYDGYNSGLFLLTDNGDGAIAASELRMLARFNGADLSLGDLRLV